MFGIVKFVQSLIWINLHCFFWKKKSDFFQLYSTVILPSIIIKTNWLNFICLIMFNDHENILAINTMSLSSKIVKFVLIFFLNSLIGGRHLKKNHENSNVISWNCTIMYFINWNFSDKKHWFSQVFTRVYRKIG